MRENPFRVLGAALGQALTAFGDTFTHGVDSLIEGLRLRGVRRTRAEQSILSPDLRRLDIPHTPQDIVIRRFNALLEVLEEHNDVGMHGERLTHTQGSAVTPPGELCAADLVRRSRQTLAPDLVTWRILPYRSRARLGLALLAHLHPTPLESPAASDYFLACYARAQLTPFVVTDLHGNASWADGQIIKDIRTATRAEDTTRRQMILLHAQTDWAADVMMNADTKHQRTAIYSPRFSVSPVRVDPTWRLQYRRQHGADAPVTGYEVAYQYSQGLRCGCDEFRAQGVCLHICAVLCVVSGVRVARHLIVTRWGDELIADEESGCYVTANASADDQLVANPSLTQMSASLARMFNSHTP